MKNDVGLYTYYDFDFMAQKSALSYLENQVTLITKTSTIGPKLSLCHGAWTDKRLLSVLQLIHYPVNNLLWYNYVAISLATN